MKTFTLIGPVADALGHVHQRNVRLPSTEYVTEQDHAFVRIGHGGQTVGVLQHLELNRNQKLIAVCTAEARMLEAGVPVWFSPTVRHRDGHDIVLTELALTRHPASVALDEDHRPRRRLHTAVDAPEDEPANGTSSTCSNAPPGQQPERQSSSAITLCMGCSKSSVRCRRSG